MLNSGWTGIIYCYWYFHTSSGNEDVDREMKTDAGIEIDLEIYVYIHIDTETVVDMHIDTKIDNCCGYIHRHRDGCRYIRTFI